MSLFSYLLSYYEYPATPNEALSHFLSEARQQDTDSIKSRISELPQEITGLMSRDFFDMSHRLGEQIIEHYKEIGFEQQDLSTLYALADIEEDSFRKTPPSLNSTQPNSHILLREMVNAFAINYLHRRDEENESALKEQVASNRLTRDTVLSSQRILSEVSFSFDRFLERLLSESGYSDGKNLTTRTEDRSLEINNQMEIDLPRWTVLFPGGNQVQGRTGEERRLNLIKKIQVFLSCNQDRATQVSYYLTQASSAYAFEINSTIFQHITRDMDELGEFHLLHYAQAHVPVDFSFEIADGSPVIIGKVIYKMINADNSDDSPIGLIEATTTINIERNLARVTLKPM
jgi:hypothetical protein